MGGWVRARAAAHGARRVPELDSFGNPQFDTKRSELGELVEWIEPGDEDEDGKLLGCDANIDERDDGRSR